jgi:RNA polymerase sigma-70 factor (ECF subfamily)
MLAAAMPAPTRPRLEATAAAPPADEVAALRRVVRAVVARVLGEPTSHPDVEDCTHEALRRAFEGTDRVRAGEPLRPWTLGIARHVAIDARRARMRARARAPHTTHATHEDSESPIDLVADPAPGPDDVVESTRRRRAVAEAMEGLPEGPRRALTLMHLEGLGYREIATRLGVPMGTVATWLSRGRRALVAAVDARPAERKGEAT